MTANLDTAAPLEPRPVLLRREGVAPIGVLAGKAAGGAVAVILAAISVSHLLNDLIQSLLPAIYPMLKTQYGLNFGQIGLITLTFQITASLLQPVVGVYTDRRPMPYSLAAGMGATLLGLLLLSMASSFAGLLVAAGLVGVGSSVFHPEASRVARMASGGRAGLAQSVFQVGGNAGQALGPLAAAYVVIPWGQHSVAWFSAVALLGMAILWGVGNWYAAERRATGSKARAAVAGPALPRRTVLLALGILLALMFSKFVYMASLSSYYTFYLKERFNVGTQQADLLLFVFLFAVAAGTVIGGLVGDRLGRKLVIWVSILGVLPFTLALPYMDLAWTCVLSMVIGFVLSSAFSAIVVFAQELMPGRVGLIAGLFFGLAFGIGGLGAEELGRLADHIGIERVFQLCAYLPAIGLLAAFLPGRRQLESREEPPLARPGPAAR